MSNRMDSRRHEMTSLRRFTLGAVASSVMVSAACGGGFGERSGTERTVDDTAGEGQAREVDSGRGDCANGLTAGSPMVPVGLEAPGGATLVARYRVEGEQIYVCTGTVLDVGGLGPESMSYAWMLGFPRATLYDACGVAGSHLGPTWTSSDGSSVVANSAVSVAAPNAGAIPWTISLTVSSSGNGLFENITAIQRLETRGGTVSGESCGPQNVHAERPAPFTATDYFYRSGSGGSGASGGAHS
jgi:uncharacterized protein DUF3455